MTICHGMKFVVVAIDLQALVVLPVLARLLILLSMVAWLRVLGLPFQGQFQPPHTPEWSTLNHQCFGFCQ
jgi:hypothetical protein